MTDDGNVQGIDVTDAILKNVAAIRTDGNIQPQPSMTVEKVSMDEGDIVMEKRRANVTSFDSAPCLSATIDDLDLSLFKHYLTHLSRRQSQTDAPYLSAHCAKNRLSIIPTGLRENF